MMRMRMGILALLAAAPALAQQTPTITGLHVRADVAISTGPAATAAAVSSATTTATAQPSSGTAAVTTTDESLATAAHALVGGSMRSHCASAPYTADSPIFHVVLVLEPQVTGLTRWRINGALADQQSPQNVYFITTTPVQMATLQTSRRSYPVINRYINELWIENLSWADASDILQELQSSPNLLSNPLGSAIAASGGLKVSTLKVTLPVTTPAAKAGVDLTNAITSAGTSFAPDQWTLMMSKLAGLTTLSGQPIAPTAVAFSSAASPTITVEAEGAASNLQAVIGAAGLNGGPQVAGSAPANRILIVDSPCLTVAVLPALSGTNVTSGTINFAGRYLFPFLNGHSSARIAANGQSPINTSSTTNTLSQFGAVLDVSFNKDMQASATTAPVRFTGGLTSTWDHDSAEDGTKMSKLAGGLKGALSFPNPLSNHTGNDTRPTFTLQAAGSSINASSGNSSQFEGEARFKGKFRWSSVFNSAVDAVYEASNEQIYGTRKSNYLINVDVLKFIVRDPLEFAATWKCGREAPSYQRVCGFYTGISITSSQ